MKNSVGTRDIPLKIQSTFMVMPMFMVMMVIGLMLMVMISCSNGSITPSNTSIPMVHTETPAPTVTISPTHDPTPIPLSHDQAQKQVIDALIVFNKIHNDFVTLMAAMAYFQQQGLMAPEVSVTISLPALDIYANALTSWRETKFKDSDWVYINHSLNNMREAELEKTGLYKVLAQQLQNAYLEEDNKQLKIILQRMVEFSESDIARKNSLIQYQLLKELSILPDEVNFTYAHLFNELPLMDNVSNEKSS